MTSVIERAIVQLGFQVDPKARKELQSFDDSLDSLLMGATKLAAAFGLVAGAVSALVASTNRETAAMNNLAESVGVSLGFLQAVGTEAKQLGLNTDNVVDLVEELNNKFGEFRALGEMTAVSESMKILQLDFKKLDKLNPEQQFIKIFEAAKNLGDQQAAVSAVDMLMGGEANKLLGHLRNIDGSMLEIIKRRLELNFLSEEGTKGAIAFTNSLGFLLDAGMSIWQQFSGLLGSALTPMLEGFQEWIRVNRKLIQSKIKEWAEAAGKVIEWLIPKVVWLIGKVKDLFEWIGKIIKRLGGFENAMKLLGTAIAAMGILKAIRLIQQFGNAAVGAQLKLFLWLAVIAGIILALEDLWLFLEDPEADTMIGRVLKKFEKWLGLDIVEPIRKAWPKIKEQLKKIGAGFKQFIELSIETFGSFFLFFVDAFEGDIGTAWDKLLVRLGDSWKALWPEAYAFFKYWFIDPFTKSIALIEKSIDQLSGFGEKALKSVGLGGLFDSGSGASSAAGSAAAGATSFQTNSIAVTVNAQTPSSAIDIGRVVSNKVQEMMSPAVTSMSTGIER